jgi:23S rRNA pseudouridine1911/1915/1917 synthase
MNAPASTVASGAERLDTWLSADQGISRSAAQALITAGLVKVNGRPGRSGQRLRPGDAVVILPAPPSPGGEPAGVRVPLQVVHEDEWLAVIDKPAGMVVHPAAGHPGGTLADGLRQRGDTWSLAGGPERPGIVHRLDRYTSGLLVVAKTEAAHRTLAAQLADRTLGRDYWALVWGGVGEDSGRIDAPIGRDPRHRQRMAVVDDGRPAITDFRVVERCPQATVLDISLRTGRTHQIRVHCAWIGRPVVGDRVYGRRDESAAARPALHARRLHLRHPADGAEREFVSPLPPDLEDLAQRARRGDL